MRFYRGLQPFKIMSFDLDDTLYDNSDVIRLAEERFLQCVQEYAQLSELTSEYWREWKWQLAEKDPLIAEDVIAWRVETLRHLLTHHGKSAVEIDGVFNRTSRLNFKTIQSISGFDDAVFEKQFHATCRFIQGFFQCFSLTGGRFV